MESARPRRRSPILWSQTLPGTTELRKLVPELLEELRIDGAALEVGGEWRLQTKESAEWENAYRTELKAVLADGAGLSGKRRQLMSGALDTALAGAASVPHGASRQPRKVHRLSPDEKEPADGVPLRLHVGWDEDLATVEKEIAAAPPTDPTIHLLLPRRRAEDLNREIATWRAAEAVMQMKGVPGTDAGVEAQKSMQSRASRALSSANALIREAVSHATIVQAGGKVVSGGLAESVKGGGHQRPGASLSSLPGWGPRRMGQSLRPAR